MVAVNSTMLAIGTTAPEFSLLEPKTGQNVSLNDYQKATGYMVMFISNHCPYVIHLKEHLSQLCKEYKQQGIKFIAINSNNIAKYPDDAPDKMIVDAKKHSYTFPYLLDETQEIAQAYKAACTPDFFLFNSDKKLVYRGQYDSTRPSSNENPTGKDLKAALDALLEGSSIPENKQKPSIGCSIKWKPGNEPDTS